MTLSATAVKFYCSKYGVHQAWSNVAWTPSSISSVPMCGGRPIRISFACLLIPDPVILRLWKAQRAQHCKANICCCGGGGGGWLLYLLWWFVVVRRTELRVIVVMILSLLLAEDLPRFSRFPLPPLYVAVTTVVVVVVIGVPQSPQLLPHPPYSVPHRL